MKEGVGNLKNLLILTSLLISGSLWADDVDKDLAFLLEEELEKLELPFERYINAKGETELIIRTHPLSCDINDFSKELLTTTYLECSGTVKINNEGRLSEKKIVKEVKITETKKEECRYNFPENNNSYKPIIIDAEQRLPASNACIYGEDKHSCYYAHTDLNGSVIYSYTIKLSRKNGRMDFSETSWLGEGKGSISTDAEDMMCRKVESDNLF